MIYQRLKDLREDKNLTQQVLADYLKTTRSAYQNYESGVRGIPIEVLEKIANFYGTSIDYLIGRTDVEAPYPKSKG